MNTKFTKCLCIVSKNPNIEIIQYYNEWNNKSTLIKNGYTLEQYKVYNEITLENIRSYYESVDR